MRPTDLTAASVWQTAQERANSSRPFCSSALRCTPPTATLALWSPLNASTSAGHRQAEGEQRRRRRASPGAGRPSIRCAAPRGRRAARRASRRRTRRGRASTQKMTKTMSMRRGKISVGAPDGRPPDPRARARPAAEPCEARDRGALSPLWSAKLRALTWMRDQATAEERAARAMNILRRLPLSPAPAAVRARGRDRRLRHGARARPRHRADAAREAARAGRPRRAGRDRPVQGVSANITLHQPPARRRQPRRRRTGGGALASNPLYAAPRAGCGSPRTAASASSCRPKRATRRSSTTATPSRSTTPPPTPSTATRRKHEQLQPRPSTGRADRPAKRRRSPRSKKRSPTSASTPTSPARRPTDVAGQPAYTVRVSPKEGGSLIGGAELSFDADNGVPLRAADLLLDSSSPR